MSVLVDLGYVVAFFAAGLGTVRLVGCALNARDRRRHVRCLANIERLELENGYQDPDREARIAGVLYAIQGPMSDAAQWQSLPDGSAPNSNGKPDRIYEGDPNLQMLWSSDDGVHWYPAIDSTPRAASGGERGNT